MTDCIILDIDGTLWDTRASIAEIWNEILKDRTDIAFRATPERLKALFGKTMWEIAAIVFPELEPEEQMKLMDECCQGENERLEEHPGEIFEEVVETIKELSKKYKVCIVSNCQAGYIELTMRALGIADYITDFECPAYTGKEKGDNIKLVMERNHFKNAVYVGDTQGDANACKIANIPFVYAEYGFGDVDGYDYKITKFPELLELF